MLKTSFAEVKDTIIRLFADKALAPIVGSGISCGCATPGGAVPSGRQMAAVMLEQLCANTQFSEADREELKKKNFQQLCDLFFKPKVVPLGISMSYLKKNFRGAHINDYRSKFFQIGWPYIYSLNIDDAIENSSCYRQIILPAKTVNEDVFNEYKCLVKLHGDIAEITTYEDALKVFSTTEYARSILSNAWLLSKMRNDYNNLNILFVACSLDNELDLATLKESRAILKEGNNINHIFYFTAEEPRSLKLLDLESYGITDVVIFEKHEDIYDSLLESWEESRKLAPNDLDKFADFTISKNMQNVKEDREFLLFGKTPFRDGAIKLPSFFINRARKANNQIYLEKRLHFIKGGRISGTSYYLIGLFELFPAYARYIFANGVKLNDAAFEKLKCLEHTMLFFDADSLSYSQFRSIIESARNTKDHFFIVIDKGDSSNLNYLIRSIQDGILKEEYYQIHEARNKLNYRQWKEINRLLPRANLPPFSDSSFIDNIINIARGLHLKNRFSETTIMVKSAEDMAFLILMATKKSLTSLNLVEYNVENAYHANKSRYAPLIEEIRVNAFEKSPDDLSAKRIMLNAPIWLYRELGVFASQSGNMDVIAGGYEFLVSRLIELSRNQRKKYIRAMKEIILFETINSIFAKREAGQKRLIHTIYKKLRGLLADDYHYLHQSAKCDLWEDPDADNRLITLKDARDKIFIASSLVENEFNATGNENLQITLDHIEFTRATILSEMATINNLQNINEICEALDSIEVACRSPYNRDMTKKHIKWKNPGRIKRFLNELMTRGNTENLLNSEYRYKVNQIWGNINEV